MTASMETVFSDLQQVVAEVEKVLAAPTEDVTTQAEEAVPSWRARLKSTQDRLATLERNAQQRIADAAHTATHALRTHPLRLVAIAAATGFVLGLALGRRDDRRR
jgi:ElaB/YqjD/DUF883 family membrane-anchored ribosome-binding protein